MERAFRPCADFASLSTVAILLEPRPRSDLTGCGLDDSTMNDLDACLTNIGRDTITEL